MNINLKYAVIAIILIFVISTITMTMFKQNNKNGGDILSQNNFSIEQKLDNAEEHYDIEPLQEKMPWLNIISARWKQILLSDYMYSGVPGPTDYLTVGLLTLDSNYLDKIKDEYQWYDDARTIPESMITDDMIGYVFQTSQDYKESYLSFLKGYNVSIFIDFEKEIVFFLY